MLYKRIIKKENIIKKKGLKKTAQWMDVLDSGTQHKSAQRMHKAPNVYCLTLETRLLLHFDIVYL